ncbi:winged helix DNA-binding domain-containing protein [Streptosporangium sp. KLBMP 9127]|nr:winged helix DNA-binding domain-containing protein [Streptosporangium sp. KLBMP 9127]
MRRSLSADDVRALRVRCQRLSGRGADGVPGVVASVAAVQAQSSPAARLAVRARTTGLTAADVDAACRRDGGVVRTWAMRGTLHMVAADDVRWMVGLLGPVFAAAGRRRRLELGLDDATAERGLTAVHTVLTGSPPLARDTIVERLAELGLVLAPRSQAPAHLLAYAAMRGLICRGPDTAAAKPTYVLLDDWVPPAPPLTPDEALTRLARRYLHAYGPATIRDFQWWSGLPATPAKRAFTLLAADLTEVTAAGIPAFVPSELDLSPAPRHVVRLLGHFDTYLLGFRSKDLVLDPAHAKHIQAGGGMIQPAILVDGHVVGTWRTADTHLQPFHTLSADLTPETTDLHRFLNAPAPHR